MLVQAFLIVGPNRTDSDLRAVERPDIDTIFLSVDYHAAIFPQHNTHTHAFEPRPLRAK